MSYVTVSIDDVIEKKRLEDPEFRQAWDESREEYRLLGEFIAIRKAQHISQTQLAELSNMQQQAISRMEKREVNPTLGTFCNVLNALGYKLQIVKQ